MLEVKGGRMPAVEADAISDVADRLFDAIEHSDIAMIQQLWNDDVAGLEDR